MYVNRTEIEQARKADLYAYLLMKHPDMFKKEGCSLRMRSNMSISVRQGHHAFRDFSSGTYGNSITFLMEYLGYSFQDAVAALSGCCDQSPAANPETTPSMPGDRLIQLPSEAPRPHTRLYAFLMKRCIPKETVGWLVSQGLLYQEKRTNNVVFVNKEKDYCEIRGTYTYAARSFHGCRKTRADRFWYFQPETGKPDTAFITEGAIDAISLFLLQKKTDIDCSRHVYISIGGVGNHLTINRIKSRIRTVLAVDNDMAGENCRKYHEDLEHIIPILKDWNEDLQKGYLLSSKTYKGKGIYRGKVLTH